MANGRPAAKGEIEITFTIRYDYYAGIPSGDRDIKADDPEVEWSIADCEPKSFHKAVLDNADVDMHDWVYERVVDEMGGE